MRAQLIERLPSFRSLQLQSEWLKERISLLLGGTQVLHSDKLGPVQPISEHYGSLNTFHKSLLSRRLRLHPRSLQGLSMMLHKYHATITQFLPAFISGLFSGIHFNITHI